MSYFRIHVEFVFYTLCYCTYLVMDLYSNQFVLVYLTFMIDTYMFKNFLYHHIFILFILISFAPVSFVYDPLKHLIIILVIEFSLIILWLNTYHD